MAQSYEKKDTIIKYKGKDIVLSIYTAKKDIWLFEYTSDDSVKEPVLLKKSSLIITNAEAVNGGVIIKDIEIDIWEELNKSKYKLTKELKEKKDKKNKSY